MTPSTTALSRALDGVENIIAEVAEQEILPRFRQLREGEVKEKTGPNDVVTVADVASEKALHAALSRLLPGSQVVGEEAVAANPAVLKTLEKSENPVWILDPLDGTLAFSQGSEVFGLIVALVHHNETVAGWIHDPIGRRTLRTEKGAGAFLNHQPVKVMPSTRLEQMSGMISSKFFDLSMKDRLLAQKKQFASIYSSVSAAHDYLNLVTGKSHFALFRRILPWDHAAGILAHSEAGGYNRRLDGTAYDVKDQIGGILLAPTVEDWRLLHSLLFPDAKIEQPKS